MPNLGWKETMLVVQVLTFIDHSLRVDDSYICGLDGASAQQLCCSPDEFLLCWSLTLPIALIIFPHNKRLSLYSCASSLRCW